MAAADGDERVLATAQHIVRMLGTNETSTEDMLRILYNFDDRFSAMNDRLRRNREAAAPSSHPAPLVASSKMRDMLDSIERTVSRWDMDASVAARSCMIWDCEPEESAFYLQAVDELQKLIEALPSSRVDRGTLDRAQYILQVAMTRLEEEFRCMVLTHSESVDPDWLFDSVSGPSFRSNCEDDPAETSSQSSGEGDGGEAIPVAQPVTDLNFTIDLIPLERISDLHDIAQRMVVGGFGRECSQVFASVRKPVLEQSLSRVGAEKLSIDDIQKMAWETLAVKITKWIQALKIAVRILFASEKRISDQVFNGLSPWRETCFSSLAKGSMMQLLSFGEAIAISRRSPERMFKVLDMYEILLDLLPEINSIFSDDIYSSIRSEANGILMRLGEAARATFTEFENAIQRDASKSPVPGGTVHPLTRYVMNYIRFLFDYADTLKQLLGDRKKEVPRLVGVETSSSTDDVGERENGGDDHLSPLGVQIIWLTVLLECNLDGKSKLYKDLAQTYLFLMNNVRYIVQKVKQSELATLLGNEWVRKHTGQVRQYATSYERAAWNRVLLCLREEGLNFNGGLSSGALKAAVKDRFKSFNSAFEEVYRAQSTWIVPDPQLREELRISITERLLSAYRSFSFRFRRFLDSERHPERYLKYTAEDLEKYLLDLFEVPSGSQPIRRKSLSTS